MKYHTFFFRKLEKISQNVSSVEVVIDALRVTPRSKFLVRVEIFNMFVFYFHMKIGKLIRLRI